MGDERKSSSVASRPIFRVSWSSAKSCCRYILVRRTERPVKVSAGENKLPVFRAKSSPKDQPPSM
jgi:hypothetical protein